MADARDRGRGPRRDRRARRRPRRRRRALVRARMPTTTTCCPATASPVPRPPSPRPAEATPEEIAAELAREAAEKAEDDAGRRPARSARPADRGRPQRHGTTTTTPGGADARAADRTGARTGMADISAELVKELRERTGAGFMDCKRALTEADGDLDKAAPLLREQGPRRGGQEGRAATPARASSRATSTPAAASACSSRSTARRTSSRAPTSSRSSSATSRSRSPGLAPLYVDAGAHPGRGPRRQAGRAARRRGGPEEAREHPAADRRGPAQEVVLAGLPATTSRSATRSGRSASSITEKIATIGENIRVRRFTRYALGEEL